MTAFKYDWASGGGPYELGTFDTKTIGRTGRRTPGYWYMKRNGIPLPVNPATYQSVTQTPGTVSYYATAARGQFESFSGNYFISLGSLPPVNEYGNILGYSELSDRQVYSSRNDALSKFYKRARNNSFETIPFVGELGESVRMIGDRAHRISTSMEEIYSPKQLNKTSWYRPLKQARPMSLSQRLAPSLRKHVRAKSDYWLEAVYGWSPLLNDVKNGAEAFAQYVEEDGIIGDRSTISSGRGSRDQFEATGITGLINLPFAQFKAYVTKTITFENKFGASSSPVMANQGVVNYVRDRLGLQWQDVLPGVWELVPYSFVVDYFTNVGDVVEAATTNTSSLSRGWSVQTIEVTYHVIVLNCTSIPGWNRSGHGSKPQIIKSFQWSRGGWTPGEVPRLSVQTPSMAQTLNLAALTLSKISKLEKVLSFF
jgi:hypothetical protein